MADESNLADCLGKSSYESNSDSSHLRHLVLSGGGPTLLQTLGTLEKLVEIGKINIADIQSIYATSAGALAATMIALYTLVSAEEKSTFFKTLSDYMIYRPWHLTFPIDVKTIFDAYSKRGLFDHLTIKACFQPLFAAQNIDLDITLGGYYEKTKIHIHMFAFELNSFSVRDISYTNYPDLPLMLALQMTCSLPILVAPVFLPNFDSSENNDCFIDGGLGCNYPLSFCLENHDKAEVLGIRNVYPDNNQTTVLNSDSTLIDYLLNFLFKCVFHVHHGYQQPFLEDNEILCHVEPLTWESLRDALTKVDVRKRLYEQGRQFGEKMK